VKRLLALLAGGLGVGALLRRRRRTVAAPGADDLRAKLAATRTASEEPPAVDAPGTPPAGAADDVDARRADVHERARRALGELDR
jgi:hypothetical protein